MLPSAHLEFRFKLTVIFFFSLVHSCARSVSSCLYNSLSSPGPLPLSPIWSRLSWSFAHTNPPLCETDQIVWCFCSEACDNFPSPTEQSPGPCKICMKTAGLPTRAPPRTPSSSPPGFWNSLSGQAFSFRLCLLLISSLGCPSQCPLSSWSSVPRLKRNFGNILTISFKTNILFLGS